jgi:hypothetical protein
VSAAPTHWGPVMKFQNERQTVAEIRAAAQAWYESQLAKCERALGPTWPALHPWIDDYLRAELRERLIARGWRPREPA